MKKFFVVAFGAFLTMTVTTVSAAIQYKVETFSGGSWFSVDEKQTVYLNVKDKDGNAVSLGDSVISNIGWMTNCTGKRLPAGILVQTLVSGTTN